MKSEVYKLNVDKLVPVSVDLSKLSDAIKKDVDNAKIKNIENKIMLLSMLKQMRLKTKKLVLITWIPIILLMLR